MNFSITMFGAFRRGSLATQRLCGRMAPVGHRLGPPGGRVVFLTLRGGGGQAECFGPVPLERDRPSKGSPRLPSYLSFRMTDTADRRWLCSPIVPRPSPLAHGAHRSGRRVAANPREGRPDQPPAQIDRERSAQA